MYARLSFSVPFPPIRKCASWIIPGSPDGTKRPGGFTQWQSSGSTWQSSRHVTDGRQARASAGGEGGGGVD